MGDLENELRIVTRGEAETEQLGEHLVTALAGEALVLLQGDLGSGKTVLVRGMARALGITTGEVQSPTYTLIHEHQGSRGDLVHIDLYRLEGREIDSLGLDELLSGPGIKAIEWAERLPDAGEDPQAITVRFERAEDELREIRIQASDRGRIDTIGATLETTGDRE